MWCADRPRRAHLLALAAIALAGAPACDGLGLAPRFDHRDTLLAGTGCERCHDAARVGTASPTTPAPLRFVHAAHARDLSGNCMRCHGAIARGARAGHTDVESDLVTGCITCHRGPTESLACLTCHESIGPGATVPASHDAHGAGFKKSHAAAARAPVTGADCASCHAQPFCGSCHDTSAPLAEARFFPADTVRATAHPPEFVALHDLEARRSPDRCLGCHVVNECASCHESAGLTPATAAGLSPHPPGWVTVPASLGANLHGEAARRDVVGCATCHGDGASCVDCHAPGAPGGSPHAAGAPPRGALDGPGCAPCHGR